MKVKRGASDSQPQVPNNPEIRESLISVLDQVYVYILADFDWEFECG